VIGLKFQLRLDSEPSVEALGLNLFLSSLVFHHNAHVGTGLLLSVVWLKARH
jgi:hypothetical protein